VLWYPAMQEWVRKANIAEFERLLALTTDPERRRLLLQLLADEKAKEPLSKRASDD
jgi:hypothetical protein